VVANSRSATALPVQGDDRNVDAVGVRVNPADDVQGSCHDGTSLSAGNGGEAPTIPGRQDIDEALPKLLLGHARSAGADPTGRTELLKDSPKASDRP